MTRATMKKLYSCADGIMTGYLKHILEDHGIACLMKNELLMGGVGELPPIECWPELWVLDDAMFARAQVILEDMVAINTGEAGPWSCPRCGESVDAEFWQCWNCQTSRKPPANADPG